MIPDYSTEFQSLSKEGRYDDLITRVNSILDQAIYKDPTRAQSSISEEAMYWHIHYHYSLYHFSKGIEIGNEYLKIVKNPTWRGRIANRLGTIYWISGNFKQADESYQLAEKLLKEHGSDIDFAGVLNNLGVLNDNQGKLTTALRYFEKSVELKRKSGNKLKEASTLVNIGIIYKHLEEYEKAIDILDLAFSYFQEANSVGGIAIVLQEKLTVYLELDEMELADKMNKQYHEIIQSRPEAVSYKIIGQINEALILKNTNSLEAKGNAIQKLNEIYQLENISIENKLLTMKNLLELKLEEFKIFQNKDVLGEIQFLLEEIDSIAHKNTMFPLIVDAHILKGKLNQVIGEFGAVTKILNEAEEIIRDNEMIHLLPKIEGEKEKFDEQLLKMKELISSNSSLVKRMEISYLEEYLKSIKL